MLLRRFMAHIQQQNWFAVTLDIIVVIVGIFLGMQVADWNEQRKEREVEQQFLNRLLADAETNRIDLNSLIEHFTRQVDAIYELGQATSAKSLQGYDESKIERGIYSLLSFPSIRFRSGTTGELLSAGKMDLIQDDEVKTLLLEQNALYEFVMTQHRDFRLFLIDKQEQYDSYTTYITLPDKIRPRMQFDFEEISNSKDFTTIIHNSLLLQRLMLDYRKNQQELNVELIKRLKCNIERTTCEPVNDGYKRNLLVLD